MSVIDTALTRLADGILMPPFYGPAAPPWVLDALAAGWPGWSCSARMSRMARSRCVS
jgi:hypothetical protein